MAGIGVVLNPHSKRYRRAPHRLSRMSFIVGERGEFKATESLQDLDKVAQQFREKEIDILAMSGGDGTVHNVLSSFIRAYGEQPMPLIALLRGGTLNNIAHSCGVRGAPEKNLMKLIYQYHSGNGLKTTTLRPMKINDAYGFIWGCGVIHRFMQAYYQKGTPSPAHAAWTLTRSIASACINGPFARRMFQRFDAEVLVNGTRWPYANYSAIYAGSIAQLGLNFQVFHYADETHFHAVGFSLPPRNVLRYVPKMYLGKPSGCPDLLEGALEEMVIRLAEPQGYTIDGDMYDPVDSFRITPGPELKAVVT